MNRCNDYEDIDNIGKCKIESKWGDLMAKKFFSFPRVMPLIFFNFWLIAETKDYIEVETYSNSNFPKLALVIRRVTRFLF